MARGELTTKAENKLLLSLWRLGAVERRYAVSDEDIPMMDIEALPSLLDKGLLCTDADAVYWLSHQGYFAAGALVARAAK